MTDEQMNFELQQMEALFGKKGNNAGNLVETKTGLTGIVYNSEKPINGKVRVYTDKGKFLCDPSSLKITGFVD